MKCERCHHNTATQAIRSEKDGKSCELFVCDDCARQSAPKPAGAVSLADILFSLEPPAPGVVRDAPPAPLADTPGEPRPLAACPSCGLTRDALREHRRFGCPACYETFGEEAKAFVRELQYGDRHVGRAPRAWKDRSRVEELKGELADAVTRQDFPRAALLRDAIAGLEARAARSGPKGKGADDGHA